MTIEIGMTGSKTAVVTLNLSADVMGSGSIATYATPAMLALMEGAAASAIEEAAGEGNTSVGTFVELHHVAATPLGATVRAEAKVIAVDGRKIRFEIAAYDEHEQIGKGEHVRFVVNTQRFVERLAKKEAA
ncbi:MAG: hotdog domain-containing protein [Chloroflexota bacterium]